MMVFEFHESVNCPARRLLRPANFPAGMPGWGVYEGQKNGIGYAVLNLQGRVFMAASDDPFRFADKLLEKIKAKVIFVDFHAEATSEKVAFGWHLDGRVTAIVGTHTHIPTADEIVLPKGTAYITDVGMTGPYDSVIGVRKELVLERFLSGMPAFPKRGSSRYVAPRRHPDCHGVCGASIFLDQTGRVCRLQSRGRSRRNERPYRGPILR